LALSIVPDITVGRWISPLDSGLAWSTIADLLRQAHEITGVKKKRARI
jgi:hypothetical protein